MTLRSRANEIPELVRRLGSSRAATVEAARARLTVLGARAVECLIAALDGEGPPIRTHAVSLLSTIQDPRARGPLVATLMDRDPSLRAAAARALARFPAPETATSLGRAARKDRDADVRIAAIRALLEHYDAGQESALGPVLGILLDGSDDRRVRVAALALLPRLRSSERRGIVRRLRQDREPAVAASAREAEETADPGRTGDAARIRRLVARLASADYAVWNDALHRLPSHGAAAVTALVDEMRRRAHDPEYCTRAGMALRALGPRRLRALAEALDRTDEPLPLQTLVEVIGAVGEKSLVYRLKDVAERIGSATGREPAGDGFDPLQRVRAKAHLEIARIGSRVAVQDLRAMLRDARRRVEIEALAAAERIGKRDEIPDLLRAWGREDRFMKERIASVVRTIMRRERIRRDSAAITALGPESRRTLDAIFAGPARRPSGARET